MPVYLGPFDNSQNIDEQGEQASHQRARTHPNAQSSPTEHEVAAEHAHGREASQQFHESRMESAIKEYYPTPPYQAAESVVNPATTYSSKTPGATDTLAISDLHWYTTKEDILAATRRAGLFLTRKDIIFAEHKVNGKSKGQIVLHCHSVENASKVVSYFLNNEFQGKKLNTSFINSNATAPPTKAPTPVPMPGRPLTGTQALLAMGPTNSHGGVNFNRVRGHARLHAQNSQNLGLGWPVAPNMPQKGNKNNNQWLGPNMGQPGMPTFQPGYGGLMSPFAAAFEEYGYA